MVPILVSLESSAGERGANIGSCIEHSPQTEDGYDELFLPERPIQRVIGILAGLRGEHNVGIFSFAMLEAAEGILLVSCLVVQ